MNGKQFESLASYARYIAGRERCHNAMTNSADTRSHDWTLGVGYDDAIRMAQSGGWAEGAKKLQRAVGLAKPFLKESVMPELDLVRAGFFADVPAYLSGSPVAMWGCDPMEQTASPVLRVGVNASLRYDTDAECAVNRGAAILGIIDELEQSGVRVELHSVYRKSGLNMGALDTDSLEKIASYQWGMDVIIKHAGDDWLPASAAFALIHPAMPRRLGFRALETHEETKGLTHNGYGSDGAKDTAYAPEFDVWFPWCQGNSGWESIEDAVKTARDMFNTQLAARQKAAA